MDKRWYGEVEFRTTECPEVDSKTYTVCPSIMSSNNSNVTVDTNDSYIPDNGKSLL